MSLEIIPVGGFGEVGRNCVAVKVDDEIFLLDLGLHVEHYVRLSQDDDISRKISKKMLIREQAGPDIEILEKKKVKAIILSHAHLDHIGAVPYMANAFTAPIFGTPFTIAVTKKLCEDKRTEMRNEFVTKNYKEKFAVSDTVKAEFIEVTHSTPHTAAIALHTKYGVVLYLNDFKLDAHPTLGNTTDINRLKALKPKVLIMDALYAYANRHQPDESTARELLEGALLSRDLKGRNILVTTFSSHIARLHELAEIADKMNRKVMFVGRSMAKYLDAAHEVGLSNLSEKRELVRYGSKVRKALSKVYHGADYLFVVTGGMAEPKAVLTRIVDEEFLPLKRNDIIAFSNRIIPTPGIIEARKAMEDKLEGKGFEVLKDLHVSGHAAAHDHRTILEELKPEVVLPTHAEDEVREKACKIAKESGVKCVIVHNGDTYSAL